MKQLFTLILLLGVISLSFAQNFTQAIGAGAYSSGSVIDQNVFALSNNPSLICSASKFELGIYHASRFGLNEIVNSYVGAAKAFKFINAGISVHQFGFDAFNRQKFAATFSRNLDKNLAMGISLAYVTTNIKEYGSSSTIVGEAGIAYRINKQLMSGIYVFNPNTVKNKESLPTMVRAGLSYKFSQELILKTEFEKVISEKERAKVGFSYLINKSFSLGFGYSSNPASFGFGCGFLYKRLRFDISATMNQILGISPHYSMIYQTDKLIYK